MLRLIFALILLLLSLEMLGNVFAQNIHQIDVNSQNLINSKVFEIQLSNNKQGVRTGIWQTGNYKIVVELSKIEEYVQNEYESLYNASLNYKNDTANYKRYTMYLERYFNAVKQLKNETNGFDLRCIVLYIGQENEKQNQGNSTIIEKLLEKWVEDDNAIVFYKDEQITTLKKEIQSDYVITIIKVYYKENEDYLFNYIANIRW